MTDTATKFLIIKSADRSSGSAQSFSIQLRNPINDVKYITLFSTNIVRTGSMTDNLILRVDIATGEVITSGEVQGTFFVPVDPTVTNILYKIGNEGIQRAHACTDSIHTIRVEVRNDDDTIPTLSGDWSMVIMAD